MDAQTPRRFRFAVYAFATWVFTAKTALAGGLIYSVLMAGAALGSLRQDWPFVLYSAGYVVSFSAIGAATAFAAAGLARAAFPRRRLPGEPYAVAAVAAGIAVSPAIGFFAGPWVLWNYVTIASIVATFFAAVRFHRAAVAKYEALVAPGAMERARG